MTEVIEATLVQIRADEQQKEYQKKLDDLINHNNEHQEEYTNKIAEITAPQEETSKIDIDSAFDSIKMRQEQEEYQKKLNELVYQPKLDDVPNRDYVFDCGELTSIRDRLTQTAPHELIYNASERGVCYYYMSILWCGCCDPYAHITTKYIKEDRWEGCSKCSDSMAFEVIRDVRRQQSCCCMIASAAPCCFCINDMADIVLYGDTEYNWSTNEKPAKWVLKRIANSFDTFERITGHLQEVHADWRKLGNRLAKKIKAAKM